MTRVTEFARVQAEALNLYDVYQLSTVKDMPISGKAIRKSPIPQ